MNRRPTLAPKLFWLPGQHKIEVRAREVGRPETIDTTPEFDRGRARHRRRPPDREVHRQGRERLPRPVGLVGLRV